MASAQFDALLEPEGIAVMEILAHKIAQEKVSLEKAAKHVAGWYVNVLRNLPGMVDGLQHGHVPFDATTPNIPTP
jgi:hypothetical protein